LLNCSAKEQSFKNEAYLWLLGRLCRSSNANHLGVCHCRFHDVFRPAAKLASTAGSVCGHSICHPAYIHSYPDRPYKVIGYLDAKTAPIRRRGVVSFAARQAKELGADAIIVLSQGSEYAGTLTTGNAFTSGNFYPGGFNATMTGTRVSIPLMFGKAQVLAIKCR
jgi:hypothetical protein